MKTIPSLLIAAVFATLTFAVWALLNRPTSEPPWPGLIQGFAFSPFRANEDPTHFQMPTDEEIEADLTLLQGKVKAVRTYSVAGTLGDVPAGDEPSIFSRRCASCGEPILQDGAQRAARAFYTARENEGGQRVRAS